MNRRGFTLVEAAISIAILGLIGAAVTGLYASSLHLQRETADSQIVDSLLRSQMERLLAGNVLTTVGGSQNVTVDGTTYRVQWTVEPMVVDGETVPASNGRKITVTIDDASLVTFTFASGGSLRKI